MPTTSEVSTRLTADNSQFSSVMNASELIAAQAGKSIFKKLDIRAGVIAIAAAIGFNIQAIAESVARFGIGLSKEMEKSLDKIATLSERTTENTRRLFAERRSDAENIAALEREQLSLQKQMESIEEQRVKRQKELAEYTAKASLFSGSRATKKAEKEDLADIVRLEELKNTQSERGIELERLRKKLVEEKARTEEKNSKEEADRLKDLGEEELRWYKKLADREKELKELKFDRLKPEEQLTKLVQEQHKLERQIADGKREHNDTTQVQIDLLKNLNKQDEINKEIAADKLKTEKEITKEKKKQYDITTTGRGDRELSDRELQRKITELQQDISRRQAGSFSQSASIGGGFAGYDALLNMQQENLQKTLGELNLRQRVRQRAGALGEDVAFRQFSGLTEQRFREILQGIDTTSTGKLATAIEKLNQRLNAPLRTLDISTPSPFG